MKLKKIKPMFNKILVTANRYKETKSIGDTTLIDTTKMEGSLLEYQKIVAIGDTVRNVKVGDLVCIDPTRYAQRKHRDGSMRDGVICDNPITTYNFEMLEMNGEQYILLYDSDISYVIEEFEED